jgi:hypothetical protein
MLGKVVRSLSLFCSFSLVLFWSNCSERPQEEKVRVGLEDFVEVRNPRSLPGNLPAKRISLGKVDDYKPCIERLPDGVLVLVAFHQHQVGEFVEEQKTTKKILEPILFFRSTDGGETWSKARVLEGVPGREPYLSVLRDGTLLLTVHLLSQDVRNRDGYTHSYIHRSTDVGYTWVTARVEPEGLDPNSGAITSRNVIELQDGSVLMGVSGPRAGQDFVWRSTNSGETWEEEAAIVAGVPVDYPYPFFGEAVLWQVPSGRIYSIVRVDSRYFPKQSETSRAKEYIDHFDRMILYASSNRGQTWDPAGDFGDYGEMYPAFLKLSSNRLLLTFTVRSGKSPLGIQAVLGEEQEDGFAFDFEHDRIMLDTKTPEGLLSGGGFGRTIELDDGTLVSSYSYRDAENHTHLEVIRWRLDLTADSDE